MSNIKPQDFERINQALIDRRLLDPAQVEDMEVFGVPSRKAYAEYLRQQGIPVLVPDGTLVPADLRDIPGDLLDEDEAVDVLEDEERSADDNTESDGLEDGDETEDSDDTESDEDEDDTESDEEETDESEDESEDEEEDESEDEDEEESEDETE